MIDITFFKEKMNDKIVRFTHHAIARAKESQMDVDTAKKMLYESISNPVKCDYRFKRYQANKQDVSTWVNGTFVFTVLAKKDEFTGRDMILVLTMTDKRLTVRYHKHL